MDITAVLDAAQSQDAGQRKAAEDQLNALEANNYPTFLGTLVSELSNETKPPSARKLAGLILKNALTAKDDALKVQKQFKWRSLDLPTKTGIRAALLQTLGSAAPEARQTAAQVIGKVAGIELPAHEWDELIPALQANMAQPSTGLKTSTLQSLGYVCEEIKATDLGQQQVNAMLTAIVQGMRKEESEDEIRLYATRALLNALEFAAQNFKNEFERNYIMQVVCEGTLCNSVDVRQAAMECLVGIANEYYDQLSSYIKDIFALTCKAVREDKEAVALQALEFWSTVAEVECELQDYEEELFHFTKQAHGALVPLLLETLTKQEEEQFEDEACWNLSMAGGTCLKFVAQCVQDEVVDLVMPFVQRNVTSANWREREAAVFAFGSIMDGPRPEKISSVFSADSFKFLLNMLKDASPHVRDSTAWTLGCIFEFLLGQGVETPLMTPDLLPAALSMLIESLKDKPQVANKVCYALQNLAEGYEEHSDSATGPLSPFFQNVAQALLFTADRPDALDSKLRTSAYETLNTLVLNAALDVCQIIVQLIPVVLEKLRATLQMQAGTAEQLELQAELQGLLCGTLQVIVQKLNPSRVSRADVPEAQKPALKQCSDAMLQYSDAMMQVFLSVFRCRSATVHEEALLAVGALVDATGPDFIKYMEAFFPFLDQGLKNYGQYQVCIITVQVVGDLCRALEERLLPWCDAIVTLLLQDLQSNELHKSVKPSILSVFGDIAMALGPVFDKYLSHAVLMLESAASHSLQTTPDGEEEAEYNNALRNGILEAYAGILQGLKNDKTKLALLTPYAPRVLAFIEALTRADDSDKQAVAQNACAVLGDMADALEGVGPLFKQSTFYKDFLNECASGDDDRLKEMADFAKRKISAVIAAC